MVNNAYKTYKKKKKKYKLKEERRKFKRRKKITPINFKFQVKIKIIKF